MNREKIWNADFTCLVLGLLLISCANYDFASSISAYAELLGKSGAYAGLLTASFYFGSVGMRLGNGIMVQKFGARKMMFAGAAICATACALHPFAGFLLLIFARIAHGAGYSIFSTAGGAAASCLVPPRRLGEGMGYFTIGNVLAMALGPAFALTLVAGGGRGEYRLLFITATAICTGAAGLTHFIDAKRCDAFRTSGGSAMKLEERLPKTFLGFESGVGFPALISFLMTFSYSPVIVYLIGCGAERGWTRIGVAFTFYAAGLLGSRLFTGRLSDRFGPDCVMYPAYLCGATALYWIAFTPSQTQLFGAMTLLGLCVGAYNPQINVFCISRCTAARRGTATAAFNGGCDLGLALGSLAGGLLIERFGYTFTLASGATLCLLTAGIYYGTLSGPAARKRVARG